MNQSRPIRVLIVNNQVLVRAGLRLLLSSWENVEVAGEAVNCREVLPALDSVRPDVLLLDIDPELHDGNLDMLSQLAGKTQARTILLTTSREPEVLTQLAAHGVAGIVNKDDAAIELRKAIEKVYQGEIWMTRSLMANLITSLTHKGTRQVKPEAAMLESLTARECDVARLVCEGLKNKEIGERLFISETTVRHHLSSIFSKLGVSARFELIIFLHRHGFAQLK